MFSQWTFVERGLEHAKWSNNIFILPGGSRDHNVRTEDLYLVRFLLRNTEAATNGVLQVKVFLEIPPNSLENTFARVSFFIKLQVDLQIY